MHVHLLFPCCTELESELTRARPGDMEQYLPCVLRAMWEGGVCTLHSSCNVYVDNNQYRNGGFLSACSMCTSIREIWIPVYKIIIIQAVSSLRSLTPYTSALKHYINDCAIVTNWTWKYIPQKYLQLGLVAAWRGRLKHYHARAHPDRTCDSLN